MILVNNKENIKKKQSREKNPKRGRNSEVMIHLWKP